MADTAVAITAGTGTNIDTRTEATNGNHRQVIVVGDPETNAGVAPVDATAGLKVNLGADNDVTVTGSVTANAGTNLNTASLALEAGGNLAAIATDAAAIEVLLGTIDADTGGILTAVQLIDNAISGSEMQVDVVAALPAGSNSIGAVTNTHLTNALIGDYETVAASQTAQTLGATGAAGDYLAGVLIVPATTSPGNVIILDNATSITIFTGGASSVSNLVPFMVPLGMLSVSGAWKITTGANVSAIGIGNFT